MSETKPKATPAPKGTKTTEVILGSAAAKLTTGVKALSDMMNEVMKLENTVQENLLIISDQEDKIASLAINLKNAVAQNKIELQQAFDSNQESFVNAWLTENEMTAISNEELQDFRNAITQAKEATEKEVKTQVAIVTNTLTSRHASEKREYELQFAAKEAETKAALSQKEEKIKFLQEQVDAWKKALEDEREASVKRAQASQIQNLNVGTGK
jgi:archaellum component FlaG (FlaF/FlaG flagellin family)